MRQILTEVGPVKKKNILTIFFDPSSPQLGIVRKIRDQIENFFKNSVFLTKMGKMHRT